MVEDYDKELLAKRVREYRKKKGFTIEKLAEEVDISASHVKNIERGKSNISLHVAYRLAYALGVTLNDLFHDTRAMEERRMARLSKYAEKFDQYSDEALETILESVMDLMDRKEKEEGG